MNNYAVNILKTDMSPVDQYTLPGEDGPAFSKVYPLIDTDMIQIEKGLLVQDGQKLVVDLYCDEEGLLKNKPRNLRASQLRLNYLKELGYDADQARAACVLVGDVALVADLQEVEQTET
jgi:hypothetical protein